MAAFSYHYQPHPFLVDSSILLPNSCSNYYPNPKVVSSSSAEAAAASTFMEELAVPNFSPPFEPTPIHESSCLLDHSSKGAALSDNEASVTKIQTTDDSTVTQTRKRKPRNNNIGVASNSAQSKDGKEGKINKKQRKCNDGVKNDKKAVDDNDNNNKKKKKLDQKKEPPTGYIHVRARRGQATDSHSLAERVRREKISERMKILQRLVPGCDKVTGKALMLDEIINYVQSLQNQVEFLSMKLASVNPMFYDFGVDLEALMVRPERVNGSITPPPPSLPQPAAAAAAAAALPCLQLQSNPTHQLTAFADHSTTFASAHNYPLLDAAAAAAALLLQQGQCQRPNVLFSHPQDNGSLMWDVEDQRQKFLNSSAGLNDNLCSFH